MSEFTMNELRDMAPAYVLGALNAEEQLAFEQALAKSDELKREVSAYRSVATQIGTAREKTPPPAIRARFLDNIAAQKALGSQPAAPSSTDSKAAAVEATKPTLSVSSGGRAATTPLTGHTAPRSNPWLPGVLAIGLAASLIFAVQRNSQVSLLGTQLAQRDSILAARTVQLAQSDSALNVLREAGANLVLVNLKTAPDNGPTMQFFWNLKTGKGMLNTAGLKPATADSVYQLWLIKDGKPVPSRTFNTGADSRSLQWGIDLPTATTGVTAVAITVEPAGGSQQPTTTPFLVGEIPKATQ